MSRINNANYLPVANIAASSTYSKPASTHIPCAWCGLRVADGNAAGAAICKPCSSGRVARIKARANRSGL